MTLKVAPKKFLVTPEGRCALDILVRLPEREGFVFSQRDFWPYERFLAETYREWSRHRLTSVVDLLGGKTKPLQIAAAGVVVALLVNRSTAPDRALQRYPAGQRRDTVDQAFFSAVEAFAQAIAGERRAKRKDPRLISGWMLYEAGRRLGDALVFSDATEDSDGSVWIRADSIPEVISTVARDLQRGNRTRATASDFGRAFDALVEQLRLELPALAGFGLVHERPVETERLRRDFLSALALQ